MDTRTFTTPEGARWIRLTGAVDASPIWLWVENVESVTRCDRRDIAIVVVADDAVPGGRRPQPQRVGDRPEWVTSVRTSGDAWHVVETIPEVLALLRGEALPEPPTVAL